MSLRLPLRAFLQRDERGDRLALDLVRASDDRRLGDARMIDERALDLHRADAMSGDVDHVVDAAEQPEVAVGVALGAVAGEVDAGAPLVPVLADVAIGIAVDAAQHRRPRPRQREQAAADLDLLAALVANLRGDAGKRPRRRAGLERRDAGQRRDHDRAGLGLPPRVDDRAALAADDAVVPDPRFRIDRLADRAEQPQRRQVVLLPATRCPTA